MSDRPSTNARPIAASFASLGAEEFAAEFRASYRVFSLIAMSVLHDAGLAEDVVQEAAMIGLRKIDQYRRGTNYSAWMGTIVRNLARNQARKEKRGRALPLNPPPTLDGDRRIAPAHASGQDIEPFLGRWLEEVGDIARACLILRTIEGLDYAEISRLLEIPEGTAMSHVHRTRRFLREKLLANSMTAPNEEKD